MPDHDSQTSPNPWWARAVRLLPKKLRPLVRRLAAIVLRQPPIDQGEDYVRRIEEESRRFAETLNVDDLPPIFGYWANTHLRPMLEAFGFSSPDDFYARHIEKRCQQAAQIHCLSIGAGNCDTELRIAQLLQARGCENWRFTCVDLVSEMLARGRDAVSAAALASRFEFVTADINKWEGDEQRYDIVIANQCLHHFVELERLFDRIARLLGDGGTFISSDMIGRNGHQRWPEAKVEVDRFWQELPKEYRFNRQLKRQEDEFLDWDCSATGFEGIRSQDILPLLCERFGFEFFLGFGNVIGPFIDRNFGGNFDAEAAWDRDFIDRVHAADEGGMDARRFTPTQMLAIMTNDRNAITVTGRGRTPDECIRWP